MKFVLIATLLVAGCSPSREVRIQQDGQKAGIVLAMGPRVMRNGVFFAGEFDEGTKSVTVAGSFNAWNPVQFFLTNTLGTRVWSGYVPMSTPGEIHFCYVIDGRWRKPDPLTEKKEDDEGFEYSVFPGLSLPAKN
ncbi:MAG TPA: hypothetical protein PLM00_03475 [Spirochaetota bacterium]|nr:hypothetical protein [Spirochaetota bacterium]HPH01615.1 hypothetical protein [Spirochaetota bacterium]HPN82422.1 hypothetical protein [Spirochaetota bacterium]